MSRLTDFLTRRSKPKDTSPGSEVSRVILESYGGLKSSFYSPLIGKENEAQVTCLQTNATYAAKGKFYSTLVKKDGLETHDWSALDYLLQESPNPTMSATVFWERVAYFYYRYNNAFIYLERDKDGDPRHLWSIDPTLVQIGSVEETGDCVLKFTLNGKQLLVYHDDIVHISRIVTKDMMFGDRMPPSIQRMLDMINLNYSGIENAIKTSTAIKFIGTISSYLDDEKKKQAAKDFTDNYLNVEGEKVGIIFNDGKVKYEPIPASQQYVANYAQANEWNKAIYKYYGCPENIIAGTATESEMLSYYERTIEPFYIRLTEEMTRKFFTRKEYGFGNRIRYKDSRLLYMNTDTRLKFFDAARELGIVTKGTLGDLLGLEVPAGIRDEIAVSQNYYQGEQQGKTGENDNNQDKEEDTDADKGS